VVGNQIEPEAVVIETKDLELPVPLGRQIAEAFDADAAGQATFDGGFDKIGRKERENVIREFIFRNRENSISNREFGPSNCEGVFE
jgi:hypothetical protein